MSEPKRGMPDKESLKSQIKRLADFIIAEIPGEPSQSQGAVDTAIRIMRTQHHFIENMDKKVSKNQLSIWAGRIMSEVEIIGYVPEWILRDIFEILGHEVEGED
jgi:hypothetical protein